MIRVHTDGPDDSKYKHWRARAAVARNQAIEARKAGEKPEFQSSVWTALKDIFLRPLFNDKCAYCEGRHSDGFHLHVEHYRPKGAVTDQRTRVDDHPGYFWLAYEWWNLLPSCAKCNSGHTEENKDTGRYEPHPGKANEFRVSGRRMFDPSEDPSHWRAELEEEEPLLLNPYHDDPEDHIDFESNGFPVPKNGSPRGRETIEVCHLDRSSLLEARRDQISDVQSAMNRMILGSEPGDVLAACKPFSAWRRRHWNTLIERLRGHCSLHS